MKTPTKPACRRVHCDSCEVLVVNGIICHESGCPDAWRDEIRECKECGSRFKPKERVEEFCDEACFHAFYGC